MSQTANTEMSLFRARLWLEEGQSERAIAVLDGLRPDNEEQQREVDYLWGWYYTEMKCWDDALRVLSPLPKFTEGDQENRLDREQLALCLLRLGYSAVQLARYEDAARHYAKCLKILQDKRLHLPLTQIKARYGLAMTHLMRGLYDAAIQHYEIALGLCLYLDDDEEIGNIYCGLCETYRRSGKLIEARLAGEKALELYKRCGNHLLQSVAHNILGNIAQQLGLYQEASEHFTASLAIAASQNGNRMIMVNCTALADLRLEEKRLEEAKEYCQRAHECVGHLKKRDEQLVGLTYLITGKVVYAQAQHAEGERRQKLLQEAVEWFKKAEGQLSVTQSYTDLAEVCGRLAYVLEELGQVREAISCWKSGYQALSSAHGPTWY